MIKHQKEPKSTNDRSFWCFFVLCHPRKHIPTTKKHEKAGKAPKSTAFEGGGGESATDTKKNNKAPKCTDDPGGGERGKHRKPLKLDLD